MLNLKNILVALVMLLPVQLLAQITCTPVFQKYYGGETNKDDEAESITYCSDGGMIVCGQTTSYSVGKYDGFLLKLTDKGVPEWTRIIGSAGNDRLIKVKQTADGGFIALGETQSFNNVKGESWLVKTDASGNILWNKRYSIASVSREKPKDIIQLKDGGYCMGINLADSTTAANAVIVKLGATGSTIWSKTLDHGNDDGVNNLAEYNDTLLIAGHAATNARNAIITKLNKADGSIISATKYGNWQSFNQEALSVEVIDNGIAFGTSLSYPRSIYGASAPFFLNHFRLNKEGGVIYHRKAEISSTSGLRIERVQCRFTSDNGFIYLANDTTPSGYSTCVKAGPYGIFEWGRNFYDYGYYGRTTGMDITGNKGYVFSGYKNDYFNTSMKNKIQVFKTDRVGKTGNCVLDLALDFIDTANYSISSFNWKSIQAAAVAEVANAMTVSSNNFTAIKGCEQLVCDTIQNLLDGCNTNFLAEYKSELNIEAADVAKLSDGSYALAGNYKYYWNLEPVIIKTNPNGSIAWTKTFNDFNHDASFLRILPTPGNTMLLMGYDSYTINHGVSDSAILMKLDYNGNVLWSRKYARGYGTSFSDIQPTNDGGFVVTVNENYGSGSGNTLIARLDANGDFLWKKEIKSLNMIVGNTLYDNSAIYVCGTAYIAYSEPSVTVLKLDAATGNYVWEKNWRSTKSQALYPIKFEKIGDTLIAAVQISTPINSYQSKKEAGFIKLNPTDGSWYNSYKITNIGHLPSDMLNSAQFNTVWVAKSASDMIFANTASVNTDTSLYITRVSLAGKLVSSKKYFNLKKNTVAALRHVDDGLVLTGNRTTRNQIDINVYETYPYIMKADETGNIADAPASITCVNSNYAANIDTFSVKEDYKRVTSVETLQESAFWGFFTYKNYLPIVRDIKKLSKVFCSTASNCSSLKIKGTDTVCNIQNVYVYSLEKNAGCTAGALWETDTAYSKIMAFTDSTITLKYIKPGTPLLKAKITSGCTGLSSEKIVTIVRQASSLNLGPDTVLCTNSSYVLRAGNGFKTYSWSHTSGSDSVATISQPGSYKLTVTDFCNNSYTDTVIVTPAIFMFSAGADTSKCNTDTIVLTATSGFLNYSWQPSYNLQNILPASVKVFPSVDTSYIVQAEKWAGCFVRDTVRITVRMSPKVWLGNDTSICRGQTLILKTMNTFATYLWSTGVVTPEILISSAGNYFLNAATVEGCHSYDTVKVALFSLPVVSLNHSSTLCFGDTRTLDAGNYTSYRWQDGSANRTFVAKNSGTYYVKVTDQNGCEGSDTTRISTIFSSPSAFLPSDTSICSYGSVSIQPHQPFKSYLWSTNETTPMIKVSKPGTYSLQVKDDNTCVGSDTINIHLMDCMKGLYVPTAFTPNNDGKNDLVRAMLFGDVRSFDFKIYNRFGQVVYQTSNPSQGWNGKLNGIEQELGAYVWVCKYQLANEQQVIEKGTVVLIR